MALNWADKPSYAALRRFRRSLTDEVERCKLACIRSVGAHTQEERERASWDLYDAQDTLDSFNNGPQGRQLDEWEEHYGQDN